MTITPVNQTIYDLTNQHYGGLDQLSRFIADNLDLFVTAFDGVPSEASINEGEISEGKKEIIRTLKGKNIETFLSI